MSNPGEKESSTWVIAHRGASQDCPENTTAAFDEALHQGCDGIELDLQLSRDGIPVVYHDKTLEKAGGGRKRVDQLELHDLERLDAGSWLDKKFRGQHIPILEEVLERYGRRTRLLLEIKTREGAAGRARHIQLRHEKIAIDISQIEEESPESTDTYINDDLLDKRKKHIERHGLDEPFRVRFDPMKKKFMLQNNSIDYRAALQASLKLVTCIVEDPNEYFLTSPSQSLILSWDAKRVPINGEQSMNPYQTDTLSALNRLRHLATAEGRYELKIEPRSLMGTLYFLSHGIHVPEKHVEQGLVTTTRYEWGDPFDWNQVTGDLLQVCCQKRKPKAAAVSVKYRGYWFYIPDSHLSSKSTFTLLLQLFELQAGGGAEGAKPVLTLSVGR